MKDSSRFSKQTIEIKSLAAEVVTEVESDDNLVVSKEEEVHEAVVQWVKHDLKRRK